MSSASAWPTEVSCGSSPAIVTIAAGAISHIPRHGLSSQIGSSPGPAPLLPCCPPFGPIRASRSAHSRFAPPARQATSVQTCATAGGCGSSENSA